MPPLNNGLAGHQVLLRDRCDLAPMACERIFVIEQAACRFEVVRTGDVDCELAVHRPKNLLIAAPCWLWVLFHRDDIDLTRSVPGLAT